MPILVIRDSRNGKVKEISLNRSRFTIGKSDWNDLVLPRKTISREHCVIFRKGASYLLRDLGSTAGTLLDNKRIEADIPLGHNARISLGEFEIVFKAGPGEAAARPDKKSQKGSAPEAANPTGMPAPVMEDGEDVDPFLLVQRKIHGQLFSARELKNVDFDKISDEEAREKTEKVAIKLIREFAGRGEIPKSIDKRALLKAVLDEALALGPLEDLLADDNISEIMVNAWNRIFCETRSDGMILSDKKFTSDEQIINVIRRIIAPLGRRINEQTPLCDARLKDGSRVNAIIPPLAVSGPAVTIRKFPKERLGIEDLVNFKSMTWPMAKFLELCVKEHLNVVISGGTGSVKTTLLNVISSFIPGKERIVTVEDISELSLPQIHVVTLEARAANLEGKGAIHIRDLVKNCLRMRPDRIVIGECRGGEALDMLQAMNTGHDGSLTTLHSNNPRECMARLETLVMMAGMDLPLKAIRDQMASAVHLVIQQARLADGSRKVTHITEVCGMEGETITLQDIFLHNQTGFDRKGKVLGYHDATGAVPNFVQKMRRRGIKVDMSIFKPSHKEENLG
ncbi:MAG: ATPase, T2SS/T4P/T4SS family [Planctomycetota bacterium]|nr:ATPase, T2SS/T4P/T4SS family [Planctomycetota bacterium]